MLIDTVRIK